MSLGRRAALAGLLGGRAGCVAVVGLTTPADLNDPAHRAAPGCFMPFPLR